MIVARRVLVFPRGEMLGCCSLRRQTYWAASYQKLNSKYAWGEVYSYRCTQRQPMKWIKFGRGDTICYIMGFTHSSSVKCRCMIRRPRWFRLSQSGTQGESQGVKCRTTDPWSWPFHRKHSYGRARRARVKPGRQMCKHILPAPTGRHFCCPLPQRLPFQHVQRSFWIICNHKTTVFLTQESGLEKWLFHSAHARME